MPDIDKVIKGLETCKSTDKTCSDCPYNGEVCTTSLCDDVLSLLKEQGAVEPFHRCIGKEFSLIEDSHFDYCPYCGKPITWAKQEGR